MPTRHRGIRAPTGGLRFQGECADSARLSAACFVARLYGVHLSAADIGQILALSFLLSFCSPGIPMGSMLMLAPIFSSVGLPAAGIGVLIAVELIPDIFKTIANVTGDMAATALLSRGHRGGGPR